METISRDKLRRIFERVNLGFFTARELPALTRLMGAQGGVSFHREDDVVLTRAARRLSAQRSKTGSPYDPTS